MTEKYSLTMLTNIVQSNLYIYLLMIQESIKIQCPGCKSVLNVKNASQLIGKVLRCPACKEERPFEDYPRVITKPKAQHSADETQYDPKYNSKAQANNDESTQYESFKQPSEKTEIKETLNETIGKLEFLGKAYELKLGVNIVGRMAASSKATVQINVQGVPPEIGKTMSRHHLQITVQKNQDNVTHLVKVMDDVPNQTFVNQKLLQKNDTLILSNGDIIKMGKVMVKFIIDGFDSESTII